MRLLILPCSTPATRLVPPSSKKSEGDTDALLTKDGPPRWPGWSPQLGSREVRTPLLLPSEDQSGSGRELKSSLPLGRRGKASRGGDDGGDHELGQPRPAGL